MIVQQRAASRRHLRGCEGLAAAAAAAGAPGAGPLALVHLPEAALAEPLIEDDLVRGPASHLYLHDQSRLVREGEREPARDKLVCSWLRQASQTTWCGIKDACAVQAMIAPTQ